MTLCRADCKKKCCDTACPPATQGHTARQAQRGACAAQQRRVARCGGQRVQRAGNAHDAAGSRAARRGTEAVDAAGRRMHLRTRPELVQGPGSACIADPAGHAPLPQAAACGREAAACAQHASRCSSRGWAALAACARRHGNSGNSVKVLGSASMSCLQTRQITALLTFHSTSPLSGCLPVCFLHCGVARGTTGVQG